MANTTMHPCSQTPRSQSSRKCIHGSHLWVLSEYGVNSQHTSPVFGITDHRIRRV